MSYRMRICLNNSWEIENPSPEVIDRAIEELRPIQDNFVILIADPRIENCDCIQTLIKRGNDPDGVFKSDELVYLVEVQFVYSKEFEKGQFNQYSFHTSDMEEVKRIFRMFALGVIPDISGWKDITADVAAAITALKESNL